MNRRTMASRSFGVLDGNVPRTVDIMAPVKATSNSYNSTRGRSSKGRHGNSNRNSNTTGSDASSKAESAELRAKRLHAKETRFAAKKKEDEAAKLVREARKLRDAARDELKSLKQSSRGAKHAAARSVYSQDIDPVTELAGWFVSGQPRKEVRSRVTQLMSCGAEGTFLIRDKQDEPDCYALAVVSGTGRLVTFLITRRPNKDGTGFYQIIGAPETEQFETLASLVGFYASDNYTSIGVKLVPEGTDELPPLTPKTTARTRYLDILPPTPMATHVRTNTKQRSSGNGGDSRKSETPDFGDAADLFAAETMHEPIAEENIYENLGAIRSGFTTDYRMRMTPPPAAAHAKVTTHDVACSPLIFTAHKSPAAATAAFGYLEESQTDCNSVPVTAYTAGSASKTTRGFNTITNFNATLKSPLNNTEQYAARASSSPKALGNYCATPDLGDTPEGTPLQERELKGIAKYGLTQTLRSKFSPSFGNLSGRGTNSRGSSGKGRRTFSLRGTAASTPGSGSSDSDGAPSRAVHGWTPPAPLPAPPHKDSIQLRHIRMEKANVHPMVMLAAMQGQSEVTPRKQAKPIKSLLKSPATPKGGAERKKSVRWDPSV